MNDKIVALKNDPETPLLLKRIEKKPEVIPTQASHFTVVTTPGYSPEMHDQQEDRYR